VNLEEFACGDSFVHRLDPRAKIAATAIYSVVVALNDSVVTSLAALAFPCLLLCAARLGVRAVARRLALVNMFIVFLWFFLPFSQGEKALYSIGPVTLYAEGVQQALLITLKSNAIVLTVMVLLGTSSVFALVHALSHMGIPDKMVHLFFFCFRYIHVIHQEYQRLTKAMRIRGFKPRTDLRTYRAYAYLVGMLLVRSFDRSQRIVAAMKCRGFNGQFYILHHYQMKRYDYVVAASSLAFCVALLAFGWLVSLPS
jgi:cobalt/nickel transport system permease protein